MDAREIEERTDRDETEPPCHPASTATRRRLRREQLRSVRRQRVRAVPAAISVADARRVRLGSTVDGECVELRAGAYQAEYASVGPLAHRPADPQVTHAAKPAMDRGEAITARQREASHLRVAERREDGG